MTPLVLIAVARESERRILAEVSEAAGFRVLAVETGALMLHAVRQRKPDLVIVDAGLPINLGEQNIPFGALTALRADDSVAKTAVLVGIERDLPGDQAVQAGADDVLYKPYRVQEVGQRLRNTVRRVYAERREVSHNEEQSWLSGLTRAGSVEQMRATLDYEALRATRFGRTLACVVVQVRGAGGVALPGAHGHIALALKKRIRNVDYLFLGTSASEFVLVLPETSAEQADVLAARIVDAFEKGQLSTAVSPGEHVLEVGISGIPKTIPTVGSELFSIAQRGVAPRRRALDATRT